MSDQNLDDDAIEDHASDASADTTASVPAELGASATLEYDAVEASAASVETRLLRQADGEEPFGVELTLDLGALSAEVVLDRAATARLSRELDSYDGTLAE
jgi:hypothetical protein